MPSHFPHYRTTSPDRAALQTVVLVTIAKFVVCGWIAVWLLSDVGTAWLGLAGLRSRCSQRASEPSSCGDLDGVQPQATAPRTSSGFSVLAHPSRNVHSCG